jgi:hypothetical protein
MLELRRLLAFVTAIASPADPLVVVVPIISNGASISVTDMLPFGPRSLIASIF